MTDQLDRKATQAGFAQLVGVSQQAISEKQSKGILHTGQTYREWLVQYCEHLREQAAGRGGDDQGRLTVARTREASASAHLKELQIMEKAGQLIPANMVQPFLESMITAARSELLTVPEKVAAAYKTLDGYDADPSVIQELIYESLNHLSTTMPAISDDAMAAGDPDMGAAP